MNIVYCEKYIWGSYAGPVLHGFLLAKTRPCSHLFKPYIQYTVVAASDHRPAIHVCVSPQTTLKHYHQIHHSSLFSCSF